MMDNAMAGMYARPPFGNGNQPFWTDLVILIMIVISLFAVGI